VAREFPDVVFEHATGYQRSDNVGTYNARFHEGRAVMGTLAGHLSKTNTIGYIGSFPIPEVVMGINAFTLAAQKINPDIKVNVVMLSSWHDPAKEADAARALIDQGADILVQHTDGPAALQVAEERGIVGGFGQGADMSAFAPKSHLSAIIDIWAPHYIQVVNDVLAGTWVSDDSWPGIAAGEVVIGPYNEKIPADVVAAAEAVKDGIVDGSINPFTGPIVDNTGTERVPAGAVVDDAGLWAMDWYVQGVQA
jgi:basic membrane protein A